MSVPAISVIVPARGPSARLSRTLGALLLQDLEAFEVLLVDNGPRPSLERWVAGGPFVTSPPLRVVHEPVAGVSAARNRGALEAHAELLLMLNDDTRPADPRLLRGHCSAQAKTPGVVVGNIAWDPGSSVSPFMAWLDGGPQFALSTLVAGPIGPEHVYTAHASLPAALLRAAGGFEPRLPFGFEDAELGRRLADAGASVRFAPELMALHEHPVGPREWWRKMHRMGEAGATVNWLAPRDPPVARPAEGLRWWALAAVGRPLSLLPIARMAPLGGLREQGYKAVHSGAYGVGYQRRRRALRRRA